MTTNITKETSQISSSAHLQEEWKLVFRGVQTCLAPYWGCFNHLEGTPLPEQRWVIGQKVVFNHIVALLIIISIFTKFAYFNRDYHHHDK